MRRQEAARKRGGARATDMASVSLRHALAPFAVLLLPLVLTGCGACEPKRAAPALPAGAAVLHPEAPGSAKSVWRRAARALRLAHRYAARSRHRQRMQHVTCGFGGPRLARPLDLVAVKTATVSRRSTAPLSQAFLAQADARRRAASSQHSLRKSRRCRLRLQQSSTPSRCRRLRAAPHRYSLIYGLVGRINLASAKSAVSCLRAIGGARQRRTCVGDAIAGLASLRARGGDLGRWSL